MWSLTGGDKAIKNTTGTTTEVSMRARVDYG